MAKASDNAFPSLLLVEGSVPATPASGRQRLYVDTADGLLKLVDDAGNVTPIGSGGGSGFGAWSSYTPTLAGSTTSPTLGSGSSITGEWRVTGDDGFEATVNITFGSSGASGGSGAYTISLPAGVSLPASPVSRTLGNGWVFNGSSTLYNVTVRRASATTVDMAVNNAQVLTNASPFTFGNNCLIDVRIAGKATLT